jgi:hypothetical protein
VTELQKQWQELLPVVQAGAEGKDVQSSIMPSEPVAFPWQVVTAENFGRLVTVYDLRIKPEPQYRPFTPEEALKQGGREIVRKTNRWKTPFYVGTDRIVVPDFLCTTSHSFSDLLEKFVFSDDGSPCGVRID